MLMLCYKAHAIPLPNPVSESSFEFSVAGSGIELLMRSYVDQLTQGLKLILGALENYSIAFEAIEGMRDQIGEALVSAAASFEVDALEDSWSGDEAGEDLEWKGHGTAPSLGNGAWSSH